MNRKKAVQLIGNGLMIAAIIFIGYKLYQYRDAFIGAFTWRIGGLMLVSALVIACLFVINGVLFGKLVGKISGAKTPIALTAKIYCKSNLYKYIPGNVLQYVGRNQIAELSNVRHEQVAFASLIEMAIQAAGALITSFILARAYVVEWFREQNLLLLAGIFLAGCLVLAAVFFLLKKKTKIFDELKTLLDRKNLLFLLALLGYFAVNQAVNGALFIWLMNALVGGLPQNYWGNVAGVYCFAWLVGFVTPGAPGGIGIREALLSVLLANVVSPEMITVAVIFNRIITVLGDLIAYPASMLIPLFSKKAE